MVLWLTSGLYAASVAKAKNIPEQLSPLSAALQGMLWLRRVLIWSAVQQDKLRPAQTTVAQQAEVFDAMGKIPEPTAPAFPAASPSPGPLSGLTSGDPLAASSQVNDQPKDAASPEQVKIISEDDGAVPSPPARPPIRPVAPPKPPITGAAGLRPEVKVEKSPDMIALNPEMEMEPFDQLPEQPRFGSVKVVCPHCRQKTKHDSSGNCKQCHEPNTRLQYRWGLVDAHQIQRSEKAAYDRDEVKSGDRVRVSVRGHRCSGCGRPARTDAQGSCIFCGTIVPGGQG